MIYATWTHDHHHIMITTFDWKLEVVHRKSQLQWIALLVWFDCADVVWTYVLTVNIITAIGSYLFAKWIWQKSTPQSSCQQNFLYMVSLSLTKFCRIFFQFKCSYIESEIFWHELIQKHMRAGPHPTICQNSSAEDNNYNFTIFIVLEFLRGVPVLKYFTQ